MLLLLLLLLLHLLLAPLFLLLLHSRCGSQDSCYPLLVLTETENKDIRLNHNDFNAAHSMANIAVKISKSSSVTVHLPLHEL
jgi:hypothetical protein